MILLYNLQVLELSKIMRCFFILNYNYIER